MTQHIVIFTQVNTFLSSQTFTDTLNSPVETGAAEVLGYSWSDDSAAGGPIYFNTEPKMIKQTSVLSTWST